MEQVPIRVRQGGSDWFAAEFKHNPEFHRRNIRKLYSGAYETPYRASGAFAVFRQLARTLK